MEKLNIPPEFFEEYPKSVLQKDYVRVWEIINNTWGSIECQYYLDKIVLMEHDNTTREGFPFDAFMELAELHNIHTDLSMTFCKDFTGWKNPDLKS